MQLKDLTKRAAKLFCVCFCLFLFVFVCFCLFLFVCFICFVCFVCFCLFCFGFCSLREREEPGYQLA